MSDGEPVPAALRALRALDLPGIARAPIAPDSRPDFLEVDPTTLTVDESYQRNLSERSVKLVRRIVEKWDWARFKPPVVTRVGDCLHVIDGQHTVIAAVTHGGVGVLPVMIVKSADVRERARAFVGHNRDRLGITPQQLHFAAVAAGDGDALTIQQVCARAGVTILKYPPPRGLFEVGQTQAIASIGALISSRGPIKARETLQCLVAANCAPLGADMIKAVATLLFAEEYRGQFTSLKLSAAVLALGGVVPPDAFQYAAARKLPLWRALVVILAQRASRRG